MTTWRAARLLLLFTFAAAAELVYLYGWAANGR